MTPLAMAMLKSLVVTLMGTEEFACVLQHVLPTIATTKNTVDS